jgi:hypothetical protein
VFVGDRVPFRGDRDDDGGDEEEAVLFASLYRRLHRRWLVLGLPLAACHPLLWVVRWCFRVGDSGWDECRVTTRTHCAFGGHCQLVAAADLGTVP